MWLSRLEMFGFKSFAKKLDLKLLGGITAIVGPNGCGKSNVVDAIRWVLGEQRPTRIRLDNMSDVIFKGSNTRRPLGLAEVSLTIENQSGVLAVDVPEITITRRLYRSGESEYLINRKPCRLCDINELFMDTGMGSDSYSLFELSMINAILSDRAEERRHIFDEAAGITKYKARRKSAVNTLIGIESDLERLNDIITELGKRVDALKRQAAKAARYRSFKNEIKSKTLALAGFEITRQKEKLRRVDESLNAVKSESSAIRASLESGTSESEGLLAGIGTLEQEHANLAGRHESAIRSVAEHENELARIETRLESLGEMIERSRESARRNSHTLDRLAEEHGARAAEEASVKAGLESVEQAHAGTRERHEALSAEIRGKLSSLNTIEGEIRTVERQIESGTARLEHLASRRSAGEARRKEIASRNQATRETINRLDGEIEAVNRSREQAAGTVEKFTGLRKNLADKYDHRLPQRDRLAEERTRLNERRAALAAERDFLDRLITSFEGLGEGVQNAVEAPCLAGRVSGVLADLVSADPEYLPAIEAALEGSLEYIVVDSPDAAREGASYLAENRIGRAVLVWADGTDVPEPSSIPGSNDGIIGPAIDFVRTEKKYRPVIARLIADVYIVDSLDRALALHESHPRHRFVTVGGEFVGGAGDIHSGKPSAETGHPALGRVEKRAELEQALAESGEVIDSIERKQAILEDNCAFLKQALAESETNLSAARERLAEVSLSVAHLTARRDAAGETLSALEGEGKAIDESFEAMEREKNETETMLRALNAKLAEMESGRQARKKETDKHTAEIESLRTEMGKLEIDRAAFREKYSALKHDLENIAERRESLALAAKRTQEEIERAEEEILSHGERKQRITDTIADFSDRLGKLEGEKTEKDTNLAKLRTLRREKEESIEKLRRELVEVSNRESALKLERDEAKLIMENIIQRLTDEFFISLEEIPETAPEDSDFEPESERRHLTELRRKVETVGDINFAAEEDYTRERERLEFLSREHSDLVEARDTLMETISRINHIAVARFRETYERIRKNFEVTFREFFEGGVCNLELIEGEDPLEGTISITARPPGKNVRSINLLSSGERALTAISLLFSIYMVKPSPFCILDEVDAPLDDANIDRFLRVIAKFSEKTQFIMITHNKKTMSRAHNLYGITMEEPGLSSLVSVRLSEVDTYEGEQSQTDTSATEQVAVGGA